MCGGNLEDRLLRTTEGLARVARLGGAHDPAPLHWRERLRIARDVTRALHYLHTPVPSPRHFSPCPLIDYPGVFHCFSLKTAAALGVHLSAFWL